MLLPDPLVKSGLVLPWLLSLVGPEARSVSRAEGGAEEAREVPAGWVHCVREEAHGLHRAAADGANVTLCFGACALSLVKAGRRRLSSLEEDSAVPSAQVWRGCAEEAEFTPSPSPAPPSGECAYKLSRRDPDAVASVCLCTQPLCNAQAPMDLLTALA